MKFLRLNQWWHAIVPQAMGWVYFCILTGGLVLPEQTQRLLAYVGALFFTAAFGYLFNDYCDIEADRVAGKKNFVAGLPAAIRLPVVLLVLSAGLLCWALPQPNLLAHTFYGLQVLLLILYSAPPVRLKNKGLWGVLADAYYGHVNPVLITLALFYNPATLVTRGVVFFVFILLVCLWLKGLRNILVHQIEDRKKDRHANTQTYVIEKGPVYALTLVNRLLVPEVVCTLLLAICLAVLFPPIIVAVVMFAVITYLKFSGWKLAYLPRRQLRFKFLYFLNDFFEQWLPVFLLIILTVAQKQYWVLLVFHVVLFPRFVTDLFKDFKQIAENFKTEEDY